MTPKEQLLCQIILKQKMLLKRQGDVHKIKKEIVKLEQALENLEKMIEDVKNTFS